MTSLMYKTTEWQSQDLIHDLRLPAWELSRWDSTCWSKIVPGWVAVSENCPPPHPSFNKLSASRPVAYWRASCYKDGLGFLVLQFCVYWFHLSNYTWSFPDAKTSLNSPLICLQDLAQGWAQISVGGKKQTKVRSADIRGSSARAPTRLCTDHVCDLKWSDWTSVHQAEHWQRDQSPWVPAIIGRTCYNICEAFPTMAGIRQPLRKRDPQLPVTAVAVVVKKQAP